MGQFNSRIRLVRLRPEFASFYPNLDPMVWETASELAARLLAQPATQRSPGSGNRILSEEHFEFQGGNPRGTTGIGQRSRATDTA